MMARETGSIEQFIFLSDVVAFIPTTPSRRTTLQALMECIPYTGGLGDVPVSTEYVRRRW